MTDDMLRAVAKNGGVVMINYHAAFLSEEFRAAEREDAGCRSRRMAAMSKTVRRQRGLHHRWRASASITKRWRVARCRK